jgi:dihydrofolate synthase/folylpolyglutamate synthase
MVLGREVDVRRRLAVGGQVIDVRTSLGWYRDLFVPLHGPPQASNAALAVAACEAFAGAALDVGAVREGLSGVRVPGRIEVCARRPLVVVDGGHNPDAAHAVVASVREAFERDRLLLVVGMLEDKLVENVLDILAPAADRFIVTQPADGRAAAATRLARALRRADVPEARIAVRATVGEAIALALEEAAEDDLVLVFGSFYTAGEARRWLRAGGLLSQD